MKYKPSEYINCGFYEGDDISDIERLKEKLVKCRKPHECNGGCDREIQPGEFAVRITGFSDGQPVSLYNCITCLDAWLDELHEDDEEAE